MNRNCHVLPFCLTSSFFWTWSWRTSPEFFSSPNYPDPHSFLSGLTLKPSWACKIHGYCSWVTAFLWLSIQKQHRNTLLLTLPSLCTGLSVSSSSIQKWRLLFLNPSHWSLNFFFFIWHNRLSHVSILTAEACSWLGEWVLTNTNVSNFLLLFSRGGKAA